MKTVKAFISLPMHGVSDDDVKANMKKGVEYLKNIYGEVELIDTFIDLGDVPRLVYLGRSIQLMAEADVVLFMPGWTGARGCCVEHQVALQYDIEKRYFE